MFVPLQMASEGITGSRYQWHELYWTVPTNVEWIIDIARRIFARSLIARYTVDMTRCFPGRYLFDSREIRWLPNELDCEDNGMNGWPSVKMEGWV